VTRTEEEEEEEEEEKESIKANRAKAQDLRRFTSQVCFDSHDPSHICFKWSE